MADSSGSGAADAVAAELAELEAKKKELEEWRRKVEEEDDRKSKLLLEKLQKHDDKVEAKRQLELCVTKGEELQAAFDKSMTSVQEEILTASKRKQELQERLKKLLAQLPARRAESSRLRQKFRIRVKVPDTPLNFTGTGGQEEGEGEGQGQGQGQGQGGADAIRETFSIRQRAAAPLGPAQALLTFEQAAVASRVLQLGRCCVRCEDAVLELLPRPLRSDPAAAFELHMSVSRKAVRVSNVPASCPPEQAKLLLALSFSRASVGGAEVEEVALEESGGCGGGSGGSGGGARISFLQPGAAEAPALSGKHRLLQLQPEVCLGVEPVYTFSLQKFQTFCGRSRRSLLLDRIQDPARSRDQAPLDEEELQDLLEIFFQKASNSGGEIDTIKLVSRGTQQAFFCEELGGQEGDL